MSKPVKMTASMLHHELLHRRHEMARVIKDALSLSGLSTQALSDDLGVSISTLGKIMRGSVSDVAIDKMYLIALGMGLEVTVSITTKVKV